MILTLDIGNAGIVVCCVENGKCLTRFSLAADKKRTADEYTALIELLARSRGIDLELISGAIIASVVPPLTEIAAMAVEQCTKKRPLLLGPGVRSGLNIRMDSPTELGSDLVAAAVSAAERYPLPCIFIDMGAATAVGVIDAKGCYIGGLICPGIAISQTSLVQSASQLPDVGLSQPRHVIGKNTRDSMQSGLIYGAAAMLDGVIQRIEAELGESAKSVVATGEKAGVILRHCSRQDIILDDDLVMYGLWKIWCRNRTDA